MQNKIHNLTKILPPSQNIKGLIQNKNHTNLGHFGSLKDLEVNSSSTPSSSGSKVVVKLVVLLAQ